MSHTTVIADKYRLDERLGEGGMGIVHAAHHLELNTRFAIKTLQPKLAADPIARARFLREARLAACIEGDHSTRIHDVGSDETGTPYMVMEYLAGESADQRLERVGALPVQDVATIMMQVLDVLAEAHARGLVHRDLKPANLFLVQRMGEAVWVKVMDFGISKMTEAAGPTSAEGKSKTLTEPHTLLGSPEYMSPEQLRDSTNVDAAADIWACGVVMFELLTAQMPFEGKSLADLYAQIISGAPRDVKKLCPSSVPEPIATLIQACLQKDQALRPASTYDVASVLAPFASDSARALLPRILAWSRNDTRPASLSPRSVPAPSLRASTSEPPVPVVQPKFRSARVQTLVGLALVAGAATAAYFATPRSSLQRADAAPNLPVPALEQVESKAAPSAPEPSTTSQGQAPPAGSTGPSAPQRTAPPAKTKKSTESRNQGIDGIELLK